MGRPGVERREPQRLRSAGHHSFLVTRSQVRSLDYLFPPTQHIYGTFILRQNPKKSILLQCGSLNEGGTGSPCRQSPAGSAEQ